MKSTILGCIAAMFLFCTSAVAATVDFTFYAGGGAGSTVAYLPAPSSWGENGGSSLTLAAGDCSPVCGTIAFANTLGEDILQWSSLLYTAVLTVDSIASTISIAIQPLAGADSVTASITGALGLEIWPGQLLVDEGGAGIWHRRSLRRS